MLESLAKIVWADAGAAGITRRRGCPKTTLARISHQLSAPAPDTSAITTLRLVGLPNVL
jgi:hypothetical protein